MAKTDFESGRTLVYIPQVDVATRLQISRNHVARMEKNGLLPTADVWIAKYLRGWDPERIDLFAIDAGILDEEGNFLTGPAVTPARRDETKALVVEKYSQPTRLYLGSVLVAALLDRDYSAVYTARGRDQWEAADVKVGSRYGWDEWRTIEFGKKSGRIGEDRIDAWMSERTLDHGLDPRADWIIERVTAPATKGRAGRSGAIKAWRTAAKKADIPLPV